MKRFKNLHLDPASKGATVQGDKLNLNIKIVQATMLDDETMGFQLCIINDKWMFPLLSTAVVMPGFEEHIGIPIEYLRQMNLLLTPTSNVYHGEDGAGEGYLCVDGLPINPYQYGSYLDELVMRVVVSSVHKEDELTLEEGVEQFLGGYDTTPFELAYEYQVVADITELTMEAAAGACLAMIGQTGAPKKRATLSIMELFNFMDTGGSCGRTLN